MSVGQNQNSPGNQIEIIPPPNVAPLLSTTNLTIQLKKKSHNRALVNNVSFSIRSGQTLALVGESGSGKTITSLALLGLLPNQLQQTNGEIRFEGNVLSHRGNHHFSQVRGAQMTMIFQEPLAALNPVFCVGHQIKDVMKSHLKIPSRFAIKRILELFNQVGLKNPERVYKAYPHQLSGGMAQRVMISMALSCNPKLLIADEPTTSLDTLTQNKILNLISNLQKEYNFSLLLISHDNKVVEQMADSKVQMHAGRIIETCVPVGAVSVPL